VDHVSLIQHWGYLVLIPLIIFEGPATTFVAAYLASRGVFNVYAILSLSIIFTLIGDVLYYLEGYYGARLFPMPWRKRIGLSGERMTRIERFYRRNGGKTLVLGKLSLVFDAVVVLCAGLIHYPMDRFLLYNVVSEVPKSLIIVALGYYFGRTIGNFDHYATEYAVVFVAVTAIVGLSYRALHKEL
jgi:membrane protein DedA with SNARE-associated domain